MKNSYDSEKFSVAFNRCYIYYLCLTFMHTANCLSISPWGFYPAARSKLASPKRFVGPLPPNVSFHLRGKYVL